MACVGIVGGLGVGATIHYYEKITGACKALGVVPDLAIVHADVDYGQGLVRAGELDQLAEYLAVFERLRKTGVTAGVLPARWLPFLLLLLASACLYCGGMVWNDYFDRAQDKLERPSRPIPSGRVSPGEAARRLAG